MDTIEKTTTDQTADRIDAAVRYIKANPQSRTPQIAAHLNVCRSKCSAILKEAIRQGRLAYVRMGGTVVWVLADDAERMQSEARRLSREMELARRAEQNAREKAARHAAIAEALDDDPIRRIFVRAGELPTPHTTAPRSVFDWRPAA